MWKVFRIKQNYYVRVINVKGLFSEKSMQYKLKEFNRNVPDNELIDDLKRVTEKLGLDKISSRQYNENGAKYTAGTIATRFGSWNKALEKAGLNLVNQRYVSEKDLFKNLEDVWLNVGKQPTFRNMKPPASKYSTYQYIAKFGSWINALEGFIEFINSNTDFEKDVPSDENDLESDYEKEIFFKHKTKRNPSERLKVQVLMRDGNQCRLCGITVTGNDIHFDHIFPWSKGGETTLENLQILCKTHNLAKGNLEYEAK